MKKYLANNNITVKDALKKLNHAASKVLIIVDDSNRLLGTLTDGDIRRYILADGDLSDIIENVYNHNPYVIYENEINHHDYVRNIFIEKKVDLLPVINSDDKLIDAIVWKNYFAEKSIEEHDPIEVPVIIMAGGKGTRLEPFTNVLPKPLIPVGDQTILEYIINEYRKFSVSDFIITIKYKGKLIKAYLDSVEKDYMVTYLEETEYLGTAGSLKLIDNIPDTCIVSNCDIVVKANYADVIDFHRKNESVLTILSSFQHQKIPYGIVNFSKGGVVTGITEKPEYSMTINTGVYVLDKTVWKYIPDDTFFHMTDLVDALIKDNKKVMTYPVNENDYIDIGQWDEYRNSVELLK